MKRNLIASLFLIALLVTSQAFAMDLNQARRDGYVGEKLDGYVAVVKAVPGVADMVDDINKRRRDEYQRIANQNGQPINIVAKLAAEQIINGLPAGTLYQGSGGNWVKK